VYALNGTVLEHGSTLWSSAGLAKENMMKEWFWI